MGEVVEPLEVVTIRQAAWWTPLRVVLAVTALIWALAAVISGLMVVDSIGDPDSAAYGGPAGAVGWGVLFAPLVAVPWTVLAWLAGLPFIVGRSVRQRRRRVGQLPVGQSAKDSLGKGLIALGLLWMIVVALVAAALMPPLIPGLDQGPSSFSDCELAQIANGSDFTCQ